MTSTYEMLDVVNKLLLFQFYYSKLDADFRRHLHCSMCTHIYIHCFLYSKFLIALNPKCISTTASERLRFLY